MTPDRTALRSVLLLSRGLGVRGTFPHLDRKLAEGKGPHLSSAACPPLTTQQSFLRDQHAGEGKGLLVIALEPLVHHLQAGPRPTGSGRGLGKRGGGAGAHSPFAAPQTTLANRQGPAPHLGSHSPSTNLELSNFPWSNMLCLELLKLPASTPIPHRLYVPAPSRAHSRSMGPKHPSGP